MSNLELLLEQLLELHAVHNIDLIQVLNNQTEVLEKVLEQLTELNENLSNE